MILLKVDNIDVYYGQNRALNAVSFAVEKGDFVGLAGPNGAGKTTLIKALFGLVPYVNGEIILFGTAQKKFREWNKIGYLPQENILSNPIFPAVVEEIVLLGLLSNKRWPKRIMKADYRAVREILEELGIGDLRMRTFSKLSGGQQQRVMLARALVQKPELLIFDEPSTALDPKSRDTFFQLLKQLNRERGITIVFITHDTSYIKQYANKILYLDSTVKYFGTTEEFFQSKDFSHQQEQYHIHSSTRK